MRITSADFPPPPAPKPRPKWALFLWLRGLTPDDVTPLLGRSREYMRQLGLPWTDAKRAEPTQEEIARIAEWTGGEIGPADWAPPDITAVKPEGVAA